MLMHARSRRRTRRHRRNRADSGTAHEVRREYVAAKKDYRRKGTALRLAKGSPKAKAPKRAEYIEARGRYHKLGKTLAKLTKRKPRDAKANGLMRGAR